MSCIELKEEKVAEFIKEGKVVIKACASDMKCGYCDKFCPTFEEASKLYPDVKFGSIAVPMKDPIPSAFKRDFMKGDKVDGKAPFLGTPTTVLFENGVMNARLVGNQTLDVLKKFIETGETPAPKPTPQQNAEDALKQRLYQLYAMKGELVTNLEVFGEQLKKVNTELAEILSRGNNANGK